jgi:hypothetical protein
MSEALLEIGRAGIANQQRIQLDAYFAGGFDFDSETKEV